MKTEISKEFIDALIALGVAQERQRRAWNYAARAGDRQSEAFADTVDSEVESLVESLGVHTIGLAKASGAITAAINKTLDVDNVVW